MFLVRMSGGEQQQYSVNVEASSIGTSVNHREVICQVLT